MTQFIRYINLIKIDKYKNNYTGDLLNFNLHTERNIKMTSRDKI